ncbi:MAG: hypothetical protein K9L68_01090 [Spirochaetales bacterium]|nr:hypothetical protein [Spirochaetales bacterium]MCF7937171.1 hypothetical protein [Spirochaetales bacterium]
MEATNLKFGSIEINGTEYDHDLIIDRNRVLRRDKKPSKVGKKIFGHTPVTAKEMLPWNCKRLVIGTGLYGKLPIGEDVYTEAERHGVEIVAVKTPEALSYLNEEDTNFLLHLTC